MGTNYYHRTNLCDCCGRYDERHIGKNHSMFRGYRTEDWTNADGPELITWRQWKEHLAESGTVWSESGYQIPVAEFIDEVEAVPVKERRRQTQWVLDHGYTTAHDWHDPEGYSFHDGDFS